MVRYKSIICAHKPRHKKKKENGPDSLPFNETDIENCGAFYRLELIEGGFKLFHLQSETFWALF